MTQRTADSHIVRPAAVAGRFYPAAADALRGAVQHFVTLAQRQPLRCVRAVVAPHAGYPCSGAVAGAAFDALQDLPPIDRTVYLIGPAHFKAVHGVGLSSAATFATPLGSVPVATEQVEALAGSGIAHIDDLAHAPEHCLEVELPFLQHILRGRFAIVPMLCDEEAELNSLALFLAATLERRSTDLVVVSSDLSHYHSYVEAVRRDRKLLEAVAAGDIDSAERGEACGLSALLCLMQIAQHLHWDSHVLAYANSGDTCGSRQEVVGYGAIAFTVAAGRQNTPPH